MPEFEKILPSVSSENGEISVIKRVAKFNNFAWKVHKFIWNLLIIYTFKIKEKILKIEKQNNY